MAFSALRGGAGRGGRERPRHFFRMHSRGVRRRLAVRCRTRRQADGAMCGDNAIAYMCSWKRSLARRNAAVERSFDTANTILAPPSDHPLRHERDPLPLMYSPSARSAWSAARTCPTAAATSGPNCCLIVKSALLPVSLSLIRCAAKVRERRTEESYLRISVAQVTARPTAPAQSANQYARALHAHTGCAAAPCVAKCHPA